MLCLRNSSQSPHVFAMGYGSYPGCNSARFVHTLTVQMKLDLASRITLITTATAEYLYYLHFFYSSHANFREQNSKLKSEESSTSLIQSHRSPLIITCLLDPHSVICCNHNRKNKTSSSKTNIVGTTETT